jgi:hypothetical protein
MYRIIDDLLKKKKIQCINSFLLITILLKHLLNIFSWFSIQFETNPIKYKF